MRPSRPRNASQIADVANSLIDPILARRAGISTALLSAWEEIAGEAYAEFSRPEKITWPKRASESEDGGFRPGCLTVACEGARVLFLTHAQGELVHRVNGFFGFSAIDRIKVVQKPVQPPGGRRRRPPELSPAEARDLEARLQGIESEKLRAAIMRLGAGVMSEKRRKEQAGGRGKG
ncbi:DUF721 domain-containing protein [Martelella lutilitoris]|uniref:DUF721 domain-containing protein n=1 Tax=Martelella lutilitoris TaxID=2583532 RepID=A0A7T7KKN6_9HYPH|nr:DciA family protein [Martelella lutilitoris]QQM29825.1 DUF721 domain-containing protein [Martelella lutilitoris]